MPERWVPQTARLAFDPQAVTGRLSEIFQSRVARTIWLGYRWRHIVGQDFDEDCLRLAAVIETRLLQVSPPTPQELVSMARRYGRQMGWGTWSGTAEEEFWRQLLPFLIGQCLMGYVYEPKVERREVEEAQQHLVDSVGSPQLDK